MDLLLILDLSGSDEDYYNILVQLTQQIVFGVPVDHANARVAIITYSDLAAVKFYLNKYTTRDQVINALSSIGLPGGTTNTQAALSLAYNDVFTTANGDRSSVNNIAVVLTDGGSNVFPQNTSTEAAKTRVAGIELYAVSVGSSPNMGEIYSIASSLQHVFTAATIDDVGDTVYSILNRLCQ